MGPISLSMLRLGKLKTGVCLKNLLIEVAHFLKRILKMFLLELMWEDSERFLTRITDKGKICPVRSFFDHNGG